MSSVFPTHHLSIGDLILSTHPSMISTVLGSCVSVCLYSRKHKVGGMIHFAMPNAPENVPSSQAFRYGNLAIAALIEELRTLTGEASRTFEAKVTGGAAEIGGQPSSLQAGPGNVQIAREILSRFEIPITGEDVGGSLGRKVRFYTETGRLQVAEMKRTETQSQIRKVLIVDDSRTIRELLKRILEEDPELRVIGLAKDTVEAEKFIAKDKPDVITLDIHMPGLTGVDWLEKIMPVSTLPVVMISSLQMQDGNEVFRSLELGAIDYIQKPTLSEIGLVGPLIREKVKAASFAKVIRYKANAQKAMGHRFHSSQGLSREIDLRTVLAIGASTGGTEALKSVMAALPPQIPPTVIVQHIPPVFSKAFADRLNDICPFEVKEAVDGDELKISRVLIAPGGRQMKLQRNAHGFCVRITDDAPVNRHKPSVDYLFHSVASLVGPKAVGVILTGMGADGAKGLLDMRSRGARTLGQDEESSVVYGMPRVAFESGAVEIIASLLDIPKNILQVLERKKVG